VKFNRSFREVELGSDLFVGATIRDAGKNFFFPASQPHLAMNGFSSLEQLVGLLDEIFENMVFCLDQNGIIAWSLAPNQTMHGKQSRRLVHRKAAVGTGLDVKMRDPRGFFTKEEDIAVGNGTRS